jgi:hypothetical protein
MTQQERIVDMMIKTKYKTWEYENEIRIFKQTYGLFQFYKTVLTEILFGCNTPQTEIDRIKQLATDNN